MTMILIIPGRAEWPVRDWAKAALLYARERDASGEGVTSFPDGRIERDAVPVARVSYNARIWPVDDWHPDMKPLHDPADHRPNLVPLAPDPVAPRSGAASGPAASSPRRGATPVADPALLAAGDADDIFAAVRRSFGG